VLYVWKGDAMNNQHHIGSEAGSPISEGYGFRGDEFTDAMDADHVITGEERLLVAIAIQ
jgi:hypothetical protein